MRLFTVTILCALVLAPGVVAAKTWHVPSEAPTIQAGIDSAAVGDTVLVAPGTYRGEENRDLDFRGKEMTLRSSDGPAVTIINCEGSEGSPHRGFIFQNGETSASTVNGFTIEYGFAAGDWPDNHGGGAFCWDSSPLFSECIFRGNVASSGGGVCCGAGSDVVLSRCIFHGNSADYYGGGFYCETSAALLIDCDFAENTATYSGGGVHAALSPSPTLVRCTFTGHSSDKGGALACFPMTAPTLEECEFRMNSADNGGGIFCHFESSPVLFNCAVAGNTARIGGGVYCEYNCAPTLSGCVLSGNTALWRGGGVFSQGSAPVISSCTFWGNGASQGGGLSSELGSYPVLERTIVSFCIQGEAIHCFDFGGGSVPILDCCDLFGNTGGDWIGCVAEQNGISGNFSADPLFCDPDAGDLRLHCMSPCAPAQQPDCGLIGALGVGCGATATVPTTWGLIKSVFRGPGE